MKKIIFLELNDNAFGGVSGVNFTLASELLKKYSVDMVYLRSLDAKIPHPEGAGHFVARDIPWHFTEFCEIKSALRDKGIFSAAKLIFSRIADRIRLIADRSRIRKYIIENDPERIIASHYLLLDAIPKEYLSKTYFHAHTSFEATFAQKHGARILNKFNGRINYIFLSENILEKAKKAGICNAHFLYNPVRFGEIANSDEKENIIAVLSRFSPEKRLPEMISSAARVLAEFPEWRLEIYGEGAEKEKMEKALCQNESIRIFDKTNDAEKVLSRARLTLNTSEYEGFSLSIIEAAYCGVPAIAFDFGEACSEEIIQGKTGIIVPRDDWRAFENELRKLLSEPERLNKMADAAQAFAKGFSAGNQAAKLLEILFS